MPENSESPSSLPAPGKGLAVRQLFGAIARRYDIANRCLSGGLDWVWRRRAARTVRNWQPGTVLDLAAGSGSLARALTRACPGAMVVAADFCLPMLRVARRKRVRHLVQADALRLPFADHTFDAVTIAFGLRNVESWETALGEMLRVLKPGGHILILDFSVPTGAFAGIYRLYLHKVLPQVASLLTGQRSAYEYLGASIEAFPQGKTMHALLTRSGFEHPTDERLSGGIVSLYTAGRPPS